MSNKSTLRLRKGEGQQPINCLSVFQHFVGLAHKELKQYFYNEDLSPYPL